MPDPDDQIPEDARPEDARTVYQPKTTAPAAPPTPAAPTPPADEPPDTASETVFAPISRRPTTGPSSPASPPASPPPLAPAGSELPPGGSAMRYGAAQVEIGMILNGIYAVKRLIGRGGMGEVYEGVNVNDAEDRVAIKVILPSLAADPNVQAMFFKEARALRTLSHAAVVQYRVVAQEQSLGIFYIVTEFIDGPSLSDMLGKARLSSQDLRSLLRRLAEGLRAAHEVGAVHRDMSPDNVLLPGERLTAAKVIDFGIAKDLDTSSRTIIGDGFAGKLGYVAPEQLGDFGRQIGPWTDVYSLALVVLSLIQGRNVDMGSTLVDAVDRRRAGVDLSQVPADLKPVLEAMLRVNPAERLRSMDAVLAALDGVIAPAADAAGKLAAPPVRPARPGRPAAGGGKGPPLPLLIGGGVVAALAVVIVAVLLLSQPSKPSRQTAAAAAGASPAAAGPPTAATARQALQTGLSAIPCSWLRLATATDSPNGVVLKLSGVAGSTIDAQAAVNRIVSASAVHAADLDLSGVSQIGQPFCSALDGWSSFRGDTAAGQHLTTAQTQYAMTRNKDGSTSARAVFSLRLDDPRAAAALLGVDEHGQVQAMYADRKTLDAGLSAAVDGSQTLQLNTLDPGWSGILLVTGRSPIDVNLLSVAPAQRDAAWRARVRAAAQAGGWQAEMVWYQAVAPTS